MTADWDITEIPGADNLFQAEGIIAETTAKYERLYGADKSFLLINGSSGGIIASILASVRRGGKLIMTRNCHKSVFNALLLGDISPVYVYPDIVSEYGIQGAVSPSAVEEALLREPEAELSSAKPQLLWNMQRYPGYSRSGSQIRQAVDSGSGPRSTSEIFRRKTTGEIWDTSIFPPSAESSGADIVMDEHS